MTDVGTTAARRVHFGPKPKWEEAKRGGGGEGARHAAVAGSG